MEILPYDFSSTQHFAFGHNYYNFGSEKCTESNKSVEFEFKQDQLLIEEPANIDKTVVFAFKTLMKKYKKQMGDTNDISIVAGGLQQYLNKKALKKTAEDDNCYQPDSAFHKLPVRPIGLLILLLSYMYMYHISEWTWASTYDMSYS